MTDDHDDTDEIEEEAAEIDARDPDAPAEIAELVDGDDPAEAAPPPVDIDGTDA